MMHNKRRQLLRATGIGLGVAGLGALALRPGAQGAAHSNYFSLVSRALREAGIGKPCLVLDKIRLLANITQVKQHFSAHKKPMALRLVAKSLPSLPLLDFLGQQMQTKRLMLFNLPYLLQLAQERADSDILLGKPLPVAASAEFYRNLKGTDFKPQQQLQWLIDSPQRLAQYRDLARGQDLQLLINLELDVGLHRGGFADAGSLRAALDILKTEPRLKWAGMMGYDAHIAKIPDLFGNQAKALAHAKQVYQALATQAQNILGNAAGLTMNAAGSPTYRLHDGSATANEVALGSAFVKPSDFDLPLLDSLQCAAWIASPVLKAGQAFQMPYGVEVLGDMARAWNPNSRQAYFVYGGNWLADPVSPSGLSVSSLYGNSSNQQLLQGSGAQQLQVDDFVFFRPRQSEALLQQFGAIAVFEAGRISEYWPVLPAQA